MKTNKILSTAVVLLLLVNIAMLIFILKGRRHHEMPKRDNAEMMIKELNMTKQQQDDFNKLKEAHFKNIRPVFDSMRVLKQSLFNLVKSDSVSDSVVTNYSRLIAEQQAIADKATINHFRTVRALFSGEQQKKFDDFIQKMMQRRGRGGDSTRKK